MKLLVVDDDPAVRQSLRLILTDEGHDVAEARNGAEALTRASAESFDVILSDVRMGTMDGLEFLRAYQATGRGALVIMMSAYGSEESAIAAMKEGAYDYIAKPFRADEVILVLRKAEEREGLRREVETLRSALGVAASPGIVAESASMRAALDVAARVALHPTTVLVTGPSGTGKEVIAREIHRLSPRSARPFIAVNCAAIPEALLESELFGHVRGAFTGAIADRAGLFEQATGGTIFLDEIGELPVALQAKLLRVLQDGEIRAIGGTTSRRVDARVIAATARELEGDVAAGRFREDLFYRLNVVAIRLAPLVERPEDLSALIRMLSESHAARLGVAVPAMDPDALRALLDHDWPGNVRELSNAIERATVLSRKGRVTITDLPASVLPGGAAIASPGASPAEPPGELSIKRHAGAAQAEVIREALRRSGGNRRRAAALLGVSVRTLFYKLKDLGITE